MSKPDEEYRRICELRATANNQSVSLQEKELVIELQKLFPSLESQFIIRKERGWYNFDIKVGDRLIEYNGDYWHANP
jgi:hypothetical protein